MMISENLLVAGSKLVLHQSQRDCPEHVVRPGQVANAATSQRDIRRTRHFPYQIHHPVAKRRSSLMSLESDHRSTSVMSVDDFHRMVKPKIAKCCSSFFIKKPLVGRPTFHPFFWCSFHFTLFVCDGEWPQVRVQVSCRA